MGAPKNNQFWKLRSKHGRNKIFESPKVLWEGACEYFEYIDNNPVEVEDNKGTKNVNTIKLKRPYTWTGLELFLGINSFEEYKSDKESYKDFSEIIRRIDKIIYTQKFEGATIGIFKENIIARDLGLADKVKQEHSGEIKTPNITALNEDEQKKIEELLKKFDVK